VKRSDLHFGQSVFLRTLYKTDNVYGADSELRSMVGHEIIIHDFDMNITDGIRILHPTSGTIYSIHVHDIELHAPIEPEMEKAKIIKVIRGKEVTFDVDQLSI